MVFGHRGVYCRLNPKPRGSIILSVINVIQRGFFPMGFKAMFGRFGAAAIRTYIRVVYRPVCVDLPPEDGALIYVANHTSYLDGLVMLTALAKRKPYALAAKDWFDKKLCGPVFTAARCIPLNRFGLDTSWIRTASEKLREGSGVIVFPEGHTVREFGPGEFKPGFVMLSKMTGAGIVCAHHGEFRPFRKNRVYFGPAGRAYSGPMTAEALSIAGEEYRQAVILLGERAEK